MISESKRATDARYRTKLKADTFSHYGGFVCCVAGCTENNPENFELHHPDGDGNKDRAEKIGKGLRSPGGWNFYQKLKKLGYPKGYVPICRKHHDELHGRIPGKERGKCAPGEDESRKDDLVLF